MHPAAHVLSRIFALLVFCGANIQAQNQKITVSILSESPESERITQAVAARIGSTTRYTARTELGGSELALDVMCFSVEKIVVHRVTRGMDGYVCSYYTIYHPAQLFPLHTRLGHGNLDTGTFSEIVEDIFDKFVVDTSDEKLHASAGQMVQDAASFCREHEGICKTPQAKKSKTGATVPTTNEDVGPGYPLWSSFLIAALVFPGIFFASMRIGEQEKGQAI